MEKLLYFICCVFRKSNLMFFFNVFMQKSTFSVLRRHYCYYEMVRTLEVCLRYCKDMTFPSESRRS